jgi:hypothetical protein
MVDAGFGDDESTHVLFLFSGGRMLSAQSAKIVSPIPIKQFRPAPVLALLHKSIHSWQAG